MSIILSFVLLISSSIAFSNNVSANSNNAWALDGKKYEFDAINNNVFIMHGPLEEPSASNTGFMNNPGLVFAKNGLIVIDPGSSKQVGENIIKQIERVSKKPIIAIFNTHVHGDHWLGNQAIVAKYPEVKIYAHPNMITRAKNGEGRNWVNIMSQLTNGISDGTTVTYPTNSTKHQQVIRIDSEIFKIHSPTEKSHTNTDIMVEHINSQTLFLGDNGFVNRMGRFDSSSDMHNNKLVLQYALDLKLKHYVPGHGPSGNGNDVVMPFLTYLSIIKQETLKGYEQDLADYEIKPIALKKLDNYKNWHGFTDGLGRHINKMLLEVEDKE